MKKVLLSMLIIALLLCCFPATAEPLDALTGRITLHSHYDPDKTLSQEDITLLMQAGLSMPTGGNQQSIELYIVTKRETMSAMRGGNPYSQALETAPCVIVVAANNDKAFYPELQEMDAGLAAGGILTQASTLGLATCVLSIAPQTQRMQSVRTALNMGDAYTPVLMIAVGYPAVDAYTSASAVNWQEGRTHQDDIRGK